MKKYSKILIISSLLITFFSCKKDFFELTNPSEQPWKTSKDFEMAAVTPYNMAFYTGWGGAFFMSNLVIQDGMTDLIFMIPKTSESYPQNEVYYRKVETRNDRADAGFGAAYTAINEINMALDFYDNRDKYRTDGKEHPFDNANTKQISELNRIAGELHFMRAYSYYNLAYMYCPPPGSAEFSTKKVLPFKKDWSFDPSIHRVPELSDAKKIYTDIILLDIEKAIELLPEDCATSSSPSYQFGRANKYAAKALAARIYFSYGAEDQTYWDKALTVLNDIDAWPYTLNIDPLKAFNRDYALTTKGSEIIWEACYYDKQVASTPKDATLLTWNKYSAKTTTVNRDSSANISRNQKDGSTFLDETSSNRCSWHVYSMSMEIAKYINWLNPSDSIRTEEALADKRFQQLYLWIPKTDTTIPSTLRTKWIESKFTYIARPNIWCHKFFRGTVGDNTNVPVIRFPEVYLIKAIIEFKLSKDDLGLNEINKIRERAFDPNYQFTYNLETGSLGLWTVPSVQSFVTNTKFGKLSSITEKDIEKEWIKELGFEGHRLNYLKALKKDINPGDRGLFDNETREVLHFDSPKLYWLLPLREIDFQNLSN